MGTDKKMGRPTDDPKTHGYRIRLTEGELIKLDKYSSQMGLTKADIIRSGIEKVLSEGKTASNNNTESIGREFNQIASVLLQMLMDGKIEDAIKLLEEHLKAR